MISKDNETYYTYIHRRLSDKKPFYVGKGKGKRAWVHSGRNKYWERIVNKHGLIVEIAFENLSESDAFQCEIDTILELTYFGYKLCNLTQGGVGGFTREQVCKSATKRKGKPSWNKGLEHPGLKGNNNSSADLKIYTFIRNLDGLIFQGTRYDLCDAFSLNTESFGKLFYVKNRESSQGWSLIKD